MECDLIVKGKYVLPINSELEVIKDGLVAVEENIIKDVGKQSELKNKYQANEIINAGNSIIMPGLINTHTHAAMVYFRGLADDLPLNVWLENHIWPAEKKYIKPKFIKKATELACLEMIKSGTTIFNDMYYFYENVAETVRNIGMRAVVGEVVFSFPGPAYKNVNEIFCNLEKVKNKFKNEELISISLAPHAIYTCDKDLLIKCKEVAQEHNLLLHIHVSETEKEVADCKKEHRLSPVAYLEKMGFLGENVLAAHSVWLNDYDLEIYKKHNVKVSHNPISNMKLASGIVPVKKMLNMGITVSLGTDGAASNNTLDLFSDIRTCALLHKINNYEPTVTNAREVISIATINGAQALLLDHNIGSLEVGKRADIITVNLDKPHLTPIYDPYSHLAYCVNSEDVNDVIINGQVIMRNRDVKTIDEERVLREARGFKIK